MAYGPHQQSLLNIYYHHPDHLGSSSYITNSGGVVCQHMEYLPFGETLVDEHLNSNNSSFKFNGKEYDEETGNYYYSARYYDPKLSIFISVDPLAEETFSSYGYCYNNPINLVDPDGRKPFDWILITGDKIYWYGGNYGDKSNLKHTFKASSGMNNVKLSDGTTINLQKAKYQYIPNNGPTVEGKYNIDLKPDPNRVAKADGKTGQLLRNPDGGIEKIPSFVPSDSDPSVGWSYSEWGKNRARLEPVNVSQPKDNSSETGVAGSGKRDLYSFYLHDSTKGYSHGCTECETELFDQLIQYRNEGNGNIEVQVKYPNKEHKTNGGTKQEL